MTYYLRQLHQTIRNIILIFNPLNYPISTDNNVLGIYVHSIIDNGFNFNAPTRGRIYKLKWGCSAYMLFLPLLKICQISRPWALLCKQHVCLLLFTMDDYVIRSYVCIIHIIYGFGFWFLVFFSYFSCIFYGNVKRRTKKMKNECEYCWLSWKYFTYENMIICSYSTHMCTFSTYKL